MKRTILMLALVLFSATAGFAADAPSWAVIDSLKGTVSIGAAGAGGAAPAAWNAAAAGMPLVESQVLKTGAGSGAVVRFAEAGLTATVEENTVVGLGDLLLKARLEKMRGKIPQPAPGAAQTPLAVTPLTGVRGTDESGSKAEDPNRQHHWEENGAK